ncbi:MAG: hypothetical protein NTW56_18260 [Alphaproteobacteria bacterium]|nr:hypothetical protein [Alphaproteobacteria bacterium]
MDDICVPIVFTEYKIAVPQAKVDLPKFMNDWGVPDITTPAKLEDLGHAGCMFIQGATGLTRYWEYGRYDAAAKGLTRGTSIPDVTIDGLGDVRPASLKTALHAVSAKSGQGGVISAAWIPVPGKFKAMQDYADKRMRENSMASRAPYALTSNSCLHFMKGVMEAAGLSTPLLVDPRPVSYIAEIRGSFTPLDYNPRSRELKRGGKKFG